MDMTQTGKAQQAEPMLTPGEIRTAPAQQPGETVSVYSVAGGSFTCVRVTDNSRNTLYSHCYQFETYALARFAELKGA